MLLLSEMLSNQIMKPISEVRLDNLETLVKEAGTADALADRSGVSPVYISQIRSGAIDIKTGKRRNLGSVAARKLEKGMEKQNGWMDVDHSVHPTDDGGWPFSTIDRARYDQLTDSQKRGIEEWVSKQVTMYLQPATEKNEDGPAEPSAIGAA